MRLRLPTLTRNKPTPGQQAAEVALAEARQARRDVQARRPAVLALVARIRTAREENHLRERIEQAFAEHRGAAQ